MRQRLTVNWFGELLQSELFVAGFSIETKNSFAMYLTVVLVYELLDLIDWLVVRLFNFPFHD